MKDGVLVVIAKSGVMRVLVVLAGVVFAASVGFAEPIIDVAAQAEWSAGSPLPVPEPTGGTYRVLWDTSHGVYPGYEPAGNYAALVSHLGGDGFAVDTTSAGFLVDDPAGYDVLVVCTLSAYDSQYTPAEVSRITTFVADGGGLLILSENTDCPNPNVQPLASPFGVSLGLSYITERDIYTSDLASHPIFDGVSQIYMRAAGEISAVAPSTELAWEEVTGQALGAAATYGSGRVVTLGDSNLWGRTEYYDLADNRQFSVSAFNWLAVPEPATLALLCGTAALVLLKRRRS